MQDRNGKFSSTFFYVAVAFLAAVFSGGVFAQDGGGDRNQVSPARRIDQPPDRVEQRREEQQRREQDRPRFGERSIDGTGNNENSPQMGVAFTQLRRITGSHYSDGVSELAGANRPSARAVSNAVNSQDELIPNPGGASDYLWQWGQFLDHDIDLTDGTDPPEPVNIAVPAGDLFFDPDGTGTQIIPFNRSVYDDSTGTSRDNPRQQLNEITAWIDASNVYGSDEERASALRTNDGTGKLKTSDGNLLPFNTEGLPNAGGPSDTLFLAGDVRANEQVGLTAIHTLFVREHNRTAERLAREHPEWEGDRIYERARAIVGAEVQVITYREFLPALLGPRALPRYDGYRPEVDAGIINEFSGAAYRLGHSMLGPVILRLDSEGNVIPEGNLELRDAFFSPQRITVEGGIEPVLRGLASQLCQRIDTKIVDDVRNFLFGEPGSGGFDLASLNIQRGRDHGLPSYNEAREALGLPRARRFRDVTSDPETRRQLSSVYDSVDDIDMWVGGLAEDSMPGSQLGELFHTIVKRQFEALRDGDRFWYERTLTQEERTEVERTRLSDIIRRNTDIGGEIPDDVFHVAQ